MTNDIFFTFSLIALLFPAVYLLGSFVGPFLKLSDPKMEGIVFFSLGLGLFAYYAVAIGNLNAFNAPLIYAFLALVYALRWRLLRSFFAWLIELWHFLVEEKTLCYRLCLAAFLLMAALTFAVCFVPETANDSLCYQLNIPKIFANTHSTRPIFYDLNSYMPFLIQHLYAVSLVLGSVSLAKLIHWATGLFLFFSVFLTIFKTTQRKLLAFFCALVLWLTPTCINEVTSTYVDVAVALFLFLAVWLFREGFKGRDKALFFWGGVFLGLVVSTKMIALLWVAAVGLLWIGTSLLSIRRTESLKMFLVGLLGGILGCGFWFVRNWIAEHNPVFPYMENLFGGPSLGLVGSYAQVGLPKTLTSYILLPWNVTFQPDVFDRGFWIGPFYLLTIPLAIWGAWKRREARLCMAFVLLSTTLWFFVVQNARFLFPILPLYVVAVAFGVDALKGGGKLLDRSLKIAAGACIVFLLLLAVYHYRYPLRVISGQWSAKEYLEKVERTYPIAEWVNQNLPENASILNAEEIRQFYFQRSMVRDFWFRSRTHYDTKIAPGDLLMYLREKGFTHVLRAYPLPLIENSSRRYESLDNALADPVHAKRLISMESKNIREGRVSYRLFEILK